MYIFLCRNFKFKLNQIRLSNEWKEFQRLKRLNSNYVHIIVNDNIIISLILKLMQIVQIIKACWKNDKQKLNANIYKNLSD